MKLPILLAAGAFILTGSLLSQEASEDEGTKLAKQLANPVASLISVPFQANEDFRMGPTNNGYKFTLNFQPVVPISVSEDWNLIIRTILPYISQHDVFYKDVPSYPGLPNRDLDEIESRFWGDVYRQARELTGLSKDEVKALIPDGERNEINERIRKEANRAGKKFYYDELKKHPQNRSQDGLGDTTQSFFLSPKAPGPGGLIWGVGPVFLFPTATHPFLGSGQWGIGPTAVALVQKDGWTIGALANQIWSIAGDDTRSSVNAMFLQPFVSYTTKTHTTFSLNTESTYNWSTSEWTVPMNLMVSQILKIGPQPVSIQLGGRYYAEGPSGAPEWGVRLNFTLLYPTSKPEPARAGDGKTALR